MNRLELLTPMLSVVTEFVSTLGLTEGYALNAALVTPGNGVVTAFAEKTGVVAKAPAEQEVTASKADDTVQV